MIYITVWEVQDRGAPDSLSSDDGSWNMADDTTMSEVHMTVIPCVDVDPERLALSQQITCVAIERGSLRTTLLSSIGRIANDLTICQYEQLLKAFAASHTIMLGQISNL